MGTVYPTEPTAVLEIINSAVLSAGRDRRFTPVKPSELQHLTLIVSAVGRPQPISESEIGRLDPGTDGLAARDGDRWGVVLSGETSTTARMEQWAKIRAQASPDSVVQFFRLDVVRFMEHA